MDWRERKYYLIRLNDSTLYWWNRTHNDFGWKYTTYYNMLKNTIHSIKFSSPYNHFKEYWGKRKYGYYDGDVAGIKYVQFMVSCRKEYCDLFEKTMRELKKKIIRIMFI